MKLLLDFFPLILFFAALKLADIYVATGVAIVATVVQIAWMRLARHKIQPMQWVSLAVIVLFGGATIVLHNETFIKWKPTVLYWLMGGALAMGQLVLRKNLLKKLLGSELELPDDAWRVANWAWIVFFAGMGALNLWVAFNFDTQTWATFKVFGAFGLSILFGLGLFLYLGRHVKTEEVEAP
jgi:intracellular septation protein